MTNGDTTHGDMTDGSAARRGVSAPGLTADEVLTTTRAVRKRLDLRRPVERAVIEDCVRIAVQAPSGRNTQRWDFVFVDDPAKKAQVRDIWLKGLMSPVPYEPWSPAPQRMDMGSSQWTRIADSLDHLARHLHEMPYLWVPCLRVTNREELAGIRGQAGAWGSAIPAVWSFMLAARERGLGTAWTTCHLTYEREMAEVLGIEWASTVQVALSPVAYTLGTDFRPGPRGDHQDFVHWNGW